MYKGISIEAITARHANELFDLWNQQFAYFCADAEVYPCWQGNTQKILSFIQARAEKGQGLVAKTSGETVGYFAYDVFTFHDMPSAFIPFPGNAAVIQNRAAVYTALYAALAEKLVARGIRNHYLTCSYADEDVIRTLFDIGFGSYTIDAFAKPQAAEHVFDKDIRIERATAEDTDPLYEIVKRSRAYYSGSPLFLKMDEFGFDELCGLVEKGTVFLAKHEGAIVGFMNLTVSDENDVITLCPKGIGQIDEIGAYIVEEYRNRNVGNQLMDAVFGFCSQQRIPCVHVDFETANLYGNKFWRKHFEPVMLSLKRTVHADM
jgi:GNAT superfamily N-acetyltransferase